jgi:cell division protein FtsB
MQNEEIKLKVNNLQDENTQLVNEIARLQDQVDTKT